jgi:hypothetical protein
MYFTGLPTLRQLLELIFGRKIGQGLAKKNGTSTLSKNRSKQNTQRFPWICVSTFGNLWSSFLTTKKQVQKGSAIVSVLL